MSTGHISSSESEEVDSIPTDKEIKRAGTIVAAKLDEPDAVSLKEFIRMVQEELVFEGDLGPKKGILRRVLNQACRGCDEEVAVKPRSMKHQEHKHGMKHHERKHESATIERNNVHVSGGDVEQRGDTQDTVCDGCPKNLGSMLVCLPYGYQSLVLAFLVLLAFIFFLVGAFGCRTFKWYGEKYGYRGIHDGWECYDGYSYGDEPALKTGRVLGGLGAFVGVIICLMAFTILFLAIPKRFLVLFGAPVCCIMTACSLIVSFIGIFACDFDCEFTGRAYMTMGSVLLWIVATAILGCCLPVPRTREGDRRCC